MKIMNKDEKDFMEQLNDLDEESVSEIAENVPVLDDNEKKRILRQCLQKSGLPDDIEIIEETEFSDDDDEISVSGIERYDTPIWRKYASSAAALVVAVVGIASVIVLHGNMNRNDEFEVSNPPVLSTSEESQVTKIVSGSYIDNGYNANGFDYANQNDYQGIVVGSTTVNAIIQETTINSAQVNDIPEQDNNQHNVPEQNEQSDIPQVTTPPETNPPVTSQPVTASPTTTELPITTIPVVSDMNPSESTSSEVQKTFLDGRYYVVTDSEVVYGFGFFPDGTMKEFVFDIPDGSFKRYTDENYGYEITGNQFSYGLIGDETAWRTGTIIDGTDGTSFSVQFPGEMYNFSTDASILGTVFTDNISLSGIWYGNSPAGIKRYEFYNDVEGNIMYIESGTGISFSYIIDSNRVSFSIGSEDTVMSGTLVSYTENQSMIISWDDGTVESFYSEQQWLSMNQ